MFLYVDVRSKKTLNETQKWHQEKILNETQEREVMIL